VAHYCAPCIPRPANNTSHQHLNGCRLRSWKYSNSHKCSGNFHSLATHSKRTFVQIRNETPLQWNQLPKLSVAQRYTNQKTCLISACQVLLCKSTAMYKFSPYCNTTKGCGRGGAARYGAVLAVKYVPAISLSLLWEFRFPYELRLTYLKRYGKRSRHGTDRRTASIHNGASF